MAAFTLFDNAIHVRTHGAGWTAWLPGDAPMPHPQAGTACVNGSLHIKVADRLPGGGWKNWWQLPSGVLMQPMCLATNDFVSDYIVRNGNWRDCDSFVRLWQGLGGRYSLDANLKPEARWKRYDSNLTLMPLPEVGDPEGVIIEVGANVGACTVELLLRTRASVVALEPSRANLFFLTRNLRTLVQRHPEYAKRIIVLPVGAGERTEARDLLIDPDNLGNTIIDDDQTRRRRSSSEGASVTTKAATHGTNAEGASSAKGLVSEGALRLRAIVEPLDSLFPLGLGHTRLLKIDTQGFECAVLHGAANALATPPSRLQVIVAEVANAHLKAQCCKPSWLRHLLRAGGGTSLDPDLGVLQERGVQHGPWNLTCIGENSEEDMCIARRFDDALGRARPQQLYKERAPRGETKPLRRAWVDRIRYSMNACRKARREPPVLLAKAEAFWRHVGFRQPRSTTTALGGEVALVASSTGDGGGTSGLEAGSRGPDRGIGRAGSSARLERTNCYVGAGARAELGVRYLEARAERASAEIECLRWCWKMAGCDGITISRSVPAAWARWRRQGRAYRAMTPQARHGRHCYLRSSANASNCRADARFDSFVHLARNHP